MPKKITKRATGLEAALNVSKLSSEIVNVPFMNGVEVTGVVPDSTGIYRVKHGLGRPYKGFFCYQTGYVTEIPSNPVKSKELWVTGPNTTGGNLQRIARYTFGSNSTSNTSMFTGLDGDTDQHWHWRCMIVQNSASPTNYFWNPNGTSGGGWGHYHWSNGSITHAVNTSTTDVIFAHSEGYISSTYVAHAYGEIWPRQGTVRHFNTTQFTTFDSNTAASTHLGYAAAVYTTTNTNITSLGVTASIASSIGTGSWFELWKYTTAGYASTPYDFWVF